MSEVVQAHFARIYAHVEEAMQELHAHMPWGAEIKLSNGKTLKMRKFCPVEEHEGRFRFGFDLATDDGTMHLEFFVRHTGGGSFPTQEEIELLAKEMEAGR